MPDNSAGNRYIESLRAIFTGKIEPRDLPRWIHSVVAPSAAQRLVYPFLNFSVVRWLERHLRPDTRALEWGSGASTLFLARRVGTLVSVEHDPSWYSQVKGKLAAAGVSNSTLLLREGAPRQEGDPAEIVSGWEHLAGMAFRAYCDVIDEYPDGHFDFVLVDGRARMGCLKLALQKVRRPGIVVLDDSDRPRYREAAQLFGERRIDITGIGPYFREIKRTSIGVLS